MTPFFSVIITTYNRPQKLIRAIKSVIDQTYQDYELVIVNDGSDKDYSQVEEFIDAYTKIKYYYKVNEERSVARNYGVNKCHGQFICFLDDDDYYLNNHLEILHNEIEQHNFDVALYHTYSYQIKKDGIKKMMPIIPKKEGYNSLEYYVTDGIMTMNNTCGSKIVFQQFPFDTEISYAEDHYQRLMAMTTFKVFSINEYTAVYDMSDGTSTTSSNIEVDRAYLNSWRKIFSREEIISNIRADIRKKILTKKIKLLVQGHRNELSWKEFFIYIYTLLFSFTEWPFLINNIRWKVQKR